MAAPTVNSNASSQDYVLNVKAVLDKSLQDAVDYMKRLKGEMGNSLKEMKALSDQFAAGGLNVNEMNQKLAGFSNGMKGVTGAVSSANKELSTFEALGLDVTGRAVIRLSKDIKASMRSIEADTAKTKKALSEMGSNGLDVTGQAVIQLSTQIKGAMKSIEADAVKTKKKLEEFGGLGFDVTGQAVIKLSKDMKTLMNTINAPQAAAKSSIEGWTKQMANFTAELTTLPQKLSIVNAKLAELQRTGQQGSGAWLAYTSELKRLTDVQSKMDAINKGTTGGFKDLRFAVQNASYQFTDMAVQAQLGTKASVIMAQQIPQLLAGFGAWGAAAGLVATLASVIAGPLIDAFVESLSPMAGFKAAMDKADASTKEFQSTIDGLDIKKMRDDLIALQAAGGDVKLFTDIKVFDVEKIKADLDKAAEAAAGAFKSAFTNLNPFIALNNALGITVYEVDRLTDRFGLTEAQATKAQAAMKAGPDEQIRLFKELLPMLDVHNKKQRELADILETVAKAAAKSEQAQRDLVKAQQIQDAIATGRIAISRSELEQETKTAAAKLKIKDEEKKATDKLYKDMLNSSDPALKITAEQYRTLTGTTKEYQKAVKDVIKMQEEWAKLMGKTDPEIAFKKAVAEAENLAKALKKSPEELAQVVAYLEGVRDKAKAAAFEIVRIKEYAANWNVSEDTVKKIEAIGKQSKETTELLSVMTRLWKDGQTEAGNAIADSLDLKVLPAAERASSAFRRLGEESEKATSQFEYEVWRTSAEGLAATADQALKVAAAMGAVASNQDRIKEAWGKIGDASTGFKQLSLDVDAFAKEVGLSAKETDKLRQALGLVAAEKDVFTEMAVAVGTVLGSAFDKLGDVLFDSSKTFQQWSADVVKEILKILAKLALMRMFKWGVGEMGMTDIFFPKSASFSTPSGSPSSSAFGSASIPSPMGSGSGNDFTGQSSGGSRSGINITLNQNFNRDSTPAVRRATGQAAREMLGILNSAQRFA